MVAMTGHVSTDVAEQSPDAKGLSLLIIVLHYSGLDDTFECLASLEMQAYQNVHTIVVDNGSVEKPNPRLSAAYPWVEILEMPENRGWSGGNNAGIVCPSAASTHSKIATFRAWLMAEAADDKRRIESKPCCTATTHG